jgi:hypothetical protein
MAKLLQGFDDEIQNVVILIREAQFFESVAPIVFEDLLNT